MEDSYVLVIGTACLDIKGRPRSPLETGASVSGTIRTSIGGVGRNIADNLARLGVPTVLLSAVGLDRSGERVLLQSSAAGIDVSHVLEVDDFPTGAYLALLDETGSLAFAVNDTRVARTLRPRYFYDHRRLFRDAAMVVLDASPPTDSLETIFRLARQYQLPVCADPTSPALASRLCPYLSDLLLITPNVQELAAFCDIQVPDNNDAAALQAAKQLVALGVEIAVITLAERGLCYATTGESGRVPAVRTEVTDLTGGGDALTAAIIFALLNDISVSDAMPLGCSAASLTIASEHTVVPDLTLELLYDNLPV
jgi:pseudouridine kinase